jgi:N-acetylglucosaminyl-diphospho-decaprenol L-rhamnosyltransferase
VSAPDPVTVVVIHHRNPEQCAITCGAFAAQGRSVRMIVVDNGSPEPDRAALRRIPGVEMLELGRNCGFGPAANAGIRHWLRGPAGEWVVVAPHDARPRPGALDTLLEVARSRPRAAMACAEYGDRTRPVVDRYLGGLVFPLDTEGPWVPTEHPHGTMLALRRDGVRCVGLFDERYFAYVEEADLALRMTAGGWEVGMVLGAVVDNPGTDVPRPVVEYLQTRNTLLLVREHFGRYHAFIRICIAVISTVHQWLRPSQRAPWYDARARWLALGHFLSRRFGPPPVSLSG